MARPETLVPGNCYFSVGFYDDDLVLPMIDTLVYVGQSSDPDHGPMWLFKEPYASPGSEQERTADDGPALIAFSDTPLHEIVDFDGLIQRVREIAVDHPLQPLPEIPSTPADSDEFASLGPEIAKFLNSPEYVSLTITIRFTDDGLSLARRDEGYTIDFFAHPRHDPDEDSRILSLFASIGVQPLIDYVCDRGRTRVLQFPIVGKRDEVEQLCRRVLTDVCSIRRGDRLSYHFLRESDVKR